jgi:hypothetical protein
MNIHFPQVDRRSQLSSHKLTTFAIIMVVMLMLSIVRHVEFNWSVPSASIRAAQIQNSTVPVAIPAPLPPTESAQAISTPEPTANIPASLPPLAIPAPAPSMP